MRSLSKEHLTKQLRDLRTGLRHAFATPAESEAFSLEEAALLERVADAVVKRKMAAPAVVFLESLGPMSFLGSQALHFFTPIIDLAFNAKEVSQVAHLLERRDIAARLIALIEAKTASRGAAAR
jgi:hypothetical protein